MWKKLFTTLHVLLTLSAVGCCVYLFLVVKDLQKNTQPKSDRMSASADFTVRNFLNVKWLGGDYELGPTENHCGIALIHIRDGKFVSREHSLDWSVGSDGSRVVPYMVMWGQTPDGPKVACFSFGITSHGGKHFLHQMNNGIGRTFGHRDLGGYRGSRVIGMAFGKETRIGQEENEHIGGGGLEFTIQVRQEVALLVVKPFATAEEARSWAFGEREKPD